MDIIKLELPAKYQYTNVLAASLRAILERTENVPDVESVIGHVDLATQEICTNLIKHAYADLDGTIEIEIRVNSTFPQLVMQFWDQGYSFKPSEVAEPDLSQLNESGYGLFLARQLMDEVNYTGADDCGSQGKNCWRLVKNLS